MRHGSDGAADKGHEWTDPLDVVIVQTATVIGDPRTNLDRASMLIDRAVAQKRPDLIVLPEAFATGFPFKDMAAMEPYHGTVLSEMRSAAKRSRSNVFYTQLFREGGDLFNRCFHIDPHGRIAGHYDKTHLFSRSGEDREIKPGSRLSLFNVGQVRIGPLVCYELRFPELARRLSGAGASVLVYPSEWPHHRIFQWDHMISARAVENQCFVVGANICGTHSRITMGGRSKVVSPYGDVLCHLEREEGFERAMLDPARMEEVRRKIPAYRGLRTDLEGP